METSALALFPNAYCPPQLPALLVSYSPLPIPYTLSYSRHPIP